MYLVPRSRVCAPLTLRSAQWKFVSADQGGGKGAKFYEHFPDQSSCHFGQLKINKKTLIEAYTFCLKCFREDHAFGLDREKRKRQKKEQIQHRLLVWENQERDRKKEKITLELTAKLNIIWKEYMHFGQMKSKGNLIFEFLLIYTKFEIIMSDKYHKKFSWSSK